MVTRRKVKAPHYWCACRGFLFPSSTFIPQHPPPHAFPRPPSMRGAPAHDILNTGGMSHSGDTCPGLLSLQMRKHRSNDGQGYTHRHTAVGPRAGTGTCFLLCCLPHSLLLLFYRIRSRAQGRDPWMPNMRSLAWNRMT